MSEQKIYDALTEDFIRRMRNWAKAGAGLLRSGGRISSIYTMANTQRAGYKSGEPPIMLGEADDTDLALLKVPIRYRQAVQQFWRYETAPIRWHARHLRIGLESRTFIHWVMIGHDLLLTELAIQSDGFHAKAMANAQMVQVANTA